MTTVKADGRRFNFRKMQYLNHDCIFKIYLRLSFTHIICIILNTFLRLRWGQGGEVSLITSLPISYSHWCVFLPWYGTSVLFFANGNSVIRSTDISLFICYRVTPGLCRPTFVTRRRVVTMCIFPPTSATSRNKLFHSRKIFITKIRFVNGPETRLS